jgi:hypothetical protein
MNVKIKSCISHRQADLSNHVVEILQLEIQQRRYYNPELGLLVRLRTSEVEFQYCRLGGFDSATVTRICLPSKSCRAMINQFSTSWKKTRVQSSKATMQEARGKNKIENSQRHRGLISHSQPLQRNHTWRNQNPLTFDSPCHIQSSLPGPHLAHWTGLQELNCQHPRKGYPRRPCCHHPWVFLVRMDPWVVVAQNSPSNFFHQVPIFWETLSDR